MEEKAESRENRSVSKILREKKKEKDQKQKEEEHKLRLLKQQYDMEHKKHWILRIGTSRTKKIVILSIIFLIFSISSIFLVKTSILIFIICSH